MKSHLLLTGAVLLLSLCWTLGIMAQVDGNFTDSGQSLGASDSGGIAIGDVDGDGDLDAFVDNRNQGNKI